MYGFWRLHWRNFGTRTRLVFPWHFYSLCNMILAFICWQPVLPNSLAMLLLENAREVWEFVFLSCPGSGCTVVASGQNHLSKRLHRHSTWTAFPILYNRPPLPHLIRGSEGPPNSSSVCSAIFAGIRSWQTDWRPRYIVCNCRPHLRTHWAHFTVLRFIFMYVLHASVLCRLVTRWGGPGGIEAYP